MKKEKSCGAIVYRKVDGVVQFLLIHQTLGHWTFPKGHVEEGETELETAHREILEETGISVSFDEGFRVVNTYSPKQDTMKDVIFFLAQPVGGKETPQLSEVSDVRWLTCIEAAAIITYPSDRAVFKKAVDYIKVRGNWKDNLE